jgi:hypothetical protein
MQIARGMETLVASHSGVFDIVKQSKILESLYNDTIIKFVD